MSRFLFFFFLLISVGFYHPPSFAHPIDRLEGLLCTYSDHLYHTSEKLNQTAEELSLIKTTREEHKQLIAINQGACKEELDWVEKKFKLIAEVRAGEKSLDLLLQSLLETRLLYLITRTNQILAADGLIKPTPTDPAMRRHQEKYMHQQPWEKMTEIGEIERWEYRQLMIKHTFDLIHKKELSKRTIFLLKASPSLWDLLTNKSHDLGYPDQVGVYGPFLFVRDLLPKDSRWLYKAIEWYKVVWNYKPAPNMTIVGDFKEDQWLEGYARAIPHLDGEIARMLVGNPDITDPNVRNPAITEPSLMLGAKPHIRRSLDPKEKWDIVPDVEILLRTKEDPLFVEEISFSEAMKARETSSASPSPIGHSGPPSKEKNSSISKEPASADEELPKEKEPKKIQKEIPTSEGIQNFATEDSYTFVFPRGLRLFRQDLTDHSFKPCANPDKRIQEFVDILFNPNKQCTVTFDEFEHHWKRLGGKIIGNRGGSHRQLIGPDGTPWFGTYDHGGFGKNTIGYLQAAFVLAGYKPSAYDSLVIS